MKNLIILTFLFFISQNCIGQELIEITGKVVDGRLEALPGVEIKINDNTIGKTDMDGTFECQIDKNVKSLEFVFVGTEITKITFEQNCNYLEIIMLLSGGDCFATPRKNERIRKKRFNTIPKLYELAYKKRIFKSNIQCGKIQFIPWKKR